MRPRTLLGVGLAILLLAGGIVGGLLLATERRDRAESDRDAGAERAERAVAGELESLVGTAAGFAVMLERRDPADAGDFAQMAASGEDRSALRWIAWAPAVPAAEMTALGERTARPVRPLPGAGAVPANGMQYPAELVWPASRRSGMLGADLASDPTVAATVAAARDSGRALLTPPVAMPGGDEVLLVQPVFARTAASGTPAERRAGMRGAVVTAIDMERVQAVAGDARLVGVDGAGAGARPVEASGGAWGIEFSGDRAELGLPLVIALAGALLAGAVVALTFADIRRERRARRSVEDALAERRDLEDTLREERNRAEALRDLAESFVEAGLREENELTEAAGAGLAEAFGARAAGLVRFDGEAAVPVGGAGPVPPTAAEVWARVRSAGRGRRTVAGGLCVAAAPVPVDGGVWGAAWVAGDERVVPGDAVASLRPFADLIGLGITDARARHKLRREATTDAQTGLANHRTFREHLRRQIAQARRHGRDLALVVLDIDRFKRVNDTFGHQAGDAVLAEVADRLRLEAREGDVVARVGGEEFAWLMPEVGRLEAWTAADRARAAIGALPFPDVGSVTISAGVADLALARDEDELFRNADQALYLAKRYGRDIVFLHQSNEVSAVAAADPSVVAQRRAELAHLQVLAHKVADRGQLGRDHPGRVAATATALARDLGWTPERVALLEQAAVLHDVGMAAVPAMVELDTSGPLGTPAHTMIAVHPREGAQMVAAALSDEAADWVRGHHERWDGTGYPDGLARARISEGARILAVAEAWDALTTDRPYRPALGNRVALSEMRDGAGTQFWPPAVDALARVVERRHAEDAAPHG